MKTSRIRRSKTALVNARSHMTNHFSRYGKFCRMAGCHYIVGLGSGSPRGSAIRWLHWYSIYSGCCFLLYILAHVFYIFETRPWHHGEHAAFSKSGLEILTRIIIPLNGVVNLASNLRGSSAMLDFFRSCADFERASNFRPRSTPKRIAIPLAIIKHATLATLFLTLTLGLYCFIAQPIYSETSLVEIVLNKTSLLLADVLYIVYDSLHFLILTPCCEVLLQYIRAQVEDVIETVSRTEIGNRWRSSETLENARINLGIIRDLKSTLNNVWKWPIVITGTVVVFIVCIGASFASSISLPSFDISLFASYIVLKVLQFVGFAILSQTMKDEVSCHSAA